MKTLAPGKIILTGEHAVVYGCPALGVAIKQHAHAHLTHNNERNVCLSIPALKIKTSMQINELKRLYKKLDSLYTENDKTAARATHSYLSRPEELCFYAIADFLNSYRIHSANLMITLTTNIPIGAGMGSSASVLTALYLGLHSHYSITVEKQALVKEVAHAERLQHACISRLDPHITVNGGFTQYRDNTITHPDISLDKNWYLINTGTAASSTGECVSRVRNHFIDSTIRSDFKDLAINFIQALKDKKSQSVSQAIIENQRLLQHIGIVPEKVSDFIRQLKHRYGIAAKISGAGSVTGNNAGLLLAFTDNDQRTVNHLETMCRSHNYTHQPLIIDTDGARQYGSCY